MGKLWSKNMRPCLRCQKPGSIIIQEWNDFWVYLCLYCDYTFIALKNGGKPDNG